ncbi:MAG TPA: hypothetical protein VJB36_10880 [Methylomirabilota bacterium]|nr:hypothetical protein [Methylomirabilota bacterium]
MARKRSPDREIMLRPPASTEGLEVVEVDPLAEPPPPPPLNPLAGLPAPPETPYAEPAEDQTGSKGIWTAIEHL